MATYVAVFALVLAYVAMVAAYCALRTLAKLRRDTHLLSRGTRGPHGQQSLIEITTRHAELTAAVADQMDTLRAHVDASQLELKAQVDAARLEALAAVADRSGVESGALRHVALVRYDAFTELSGRTSFSLALLDDGGDGVTISAITGRSDTRVYAKAVAAGEGEHELSPEERQAVAAAMGSTRRFRKSA
jgi:Tfp pilus assembly protein PilN